MPRRVLATAVDHSYPFSQIHCVVPYSLSQTHFMEGSPPATYLPVGGEDDNLETMYPELTDQWPWFIQTDEEAWATSPPLTVGSEVAPASPITGPFSSGEALPPPPPPPPSDAARIRARRQARYDFSHGDEDLEIMFELNSDMGITLQHPERDTLAQPPPIWPEGRVEDTPGDELVNPDTSVPSGGDVGAPAGSDEGQAQVFWHTGDDGFAGHRDDVSGGDARRTLELLGARLHKDARRQLELAESRTWPGPDGAD
ncbi:unnamed protein product [Clonostachys rosea]|uniref:Anaphase-promoting complex subunit 13 n=1 Tax=Bionectria ochroleuca TaxID=29856 RepID=A0ABY6UES4_BIOOC|nr:unnamed protein product [Clonostachys rosea]